MTVTSQKAAQPAIELRDVHFAYPDAANEALRGITLSIPRGEHVCILGGNGSGKSTLARIMNALLVPTSGAARVRGIEVSDDLDDALAIRRHAAMVFQYPDDQMVTNIVADDVAFGPENLGVPAAQIAQCVDEALAAVDMAEHARRDPADLSGGQRQRIAIAGALAMQPDILILDEPAAMLDARGRASIQRIIGDLKRRGITIVHITHFMDSALEADRVIVLEDGRIALDGSPQEIFAQRDAIRTLGLDIPFTLQLADALAPVLSDLPAVPSVDDLIDAIVNAYEAGAGATTGAGGVDAARVESSGANDGAKRTHAADEAEDSRSAITFDQVSFSYLDDQHPHRASGLLDRLGVRPRQRLPREADTLRDISFTVPAGSLTALIGRTGSGKSTTAELACALKLPNTGAVRIVGTDSQDVADQPALRAQVGFVAQLPERQLFAQTVYDDVAFGPRNLGLTDDQVSERVEDALRAVGLEPSPALLERSPFALSGGQQRAVAIAGVLAMHPSALVLDEPMAGLDPQARRRMRALLRNFKAQGTTLLVISHDLDDVAELADHVIALHEGSVAAEGTPAQVFAANEQLLPGVPQPRSFAQRLQARGVPVAGAPLTIDALAQEVCHVLAR